MKPVSVAALPTRIFKLKEDLATFIIDHVPQDLIRERMVLAVTSKIVSLAEGRLVHRTEVSKADLVRREADVFLGEIGHGCFLTIKEGLMIPSAGIDESNSEDGDFILFPSDPSQSAENLWRKLRAAWKLKELGIVLTDSHTSPLRQGVTGIGLAHWGFSAVKDMIGTTDLFGRELKMTKMNLLDGLSVMAVMVMGEGRESQPLAVIHGAPLEFCEVSDPHEIRMPLEGDLYSPLLKGSFSKALK